MIAIIEYGAGNQTSVQRAFAHLGIACEVTADPARLKAAKGIFFPGVGAAGQAMGRLLDSGLDKCIYELVDMGKPFLGICLGCQIMLDSSEEDGNTKTLGLIEGKSRLFDKDLLDEEGEFIRIPHMGWNGIVPVKESPLLKGISPNAAMYFVHSYYTDLPEKWHIARSEYGHEFCTVFGRDGLWGVQFHPEKSGKEGLKILQNFADYCNKA